MLNLDNKNSEKWLFFLVAHEGVINDSTCGGNKVSLPCCGITFLAWVLLRIVSFQYLKLLIGKRLNYFILCCYANTIMTIDINGLLCV